MIEFKTIYAGGMSPVKTGGGTGGASSASDVSVNVSGFEVITGKNVQSAMKQVDTKLALNENYDSFLVSLDPLNTDIGAITNVPLQSLQTQMHDGVPSHKALGAKVYDEFGTWGIIDAIEGQTASVATVSSRGSQGVTKKYVDEQVATRAEKTAVKTLGATTALENNTIFQAGNMSSVTLTLPAITYDFVCQVEFTSPTSPTAFTAPETIKWYGDNTSSGAFVPEASKRYLIMFYTDGTAYRAIAQARA